MCLFAIFAVLAVHADFECRSFVCVCMCKDKMFVLFFFLHNFISTSTSSCYSVCILFVFRLCTMFVFPASVHQRAENANKYITWIFCFVTLFLSFFFFGLPEKIYDESFYLFLILNKWEELSFCVNLRWKTKKFF